MVDQEKDKDMTKKETKKKEVFDTHCIIQSRCPIYKYTHAPLYMSLSLALPAVNGRVANKILRHL